MIIDDANLKKTYEQARMIAISMISIPILTAVAAELFLKTMFTQGTISFYSTLQYIMIAVTALEIVLIVVIRNRILSGNDVYAVPSTEEFVSGQVPPDSTTDEKGFIKRLFSAFLTAYSLCLGVAVNGLVLFVTGNDSATFYGFLVAALFLMFLQFPRYDDWHSRLKAYLE